MKRFIITTILIALVGSVFAKPKIKETHKFVDGSWGIDFVVEDHEVSVYSDSLESILSDANKNYIVTTSMIDPLDDIESLVLKYNYVMFGEMDEVTQVVTITVIYFEGNQFKVASWYMD